MPDVQAPTRRPGPPTWFFVTIILAVAAATALAVVRTREEGTAPLAVPTWASPAQSEPAPEPTETTQPTETPTPEPELLAASCSNDRDGYGIDYPESWFTPDDRAWGCQLFDPQRIRLRPNTEAPPVAVTVFVEQFRMGRILAAFTNRQGFETISIEQGSFTDAARPGKIVETKAKANGFWPRGTKLFYVLVNRLDSTIVVMTTDLVPDYRENRRTVVAMAESLRIGG